MRETIWKTQSCKQLGKRDDSINSQGHQVTDDIFKLKAPEPTGVPGPWDKNSLVVIANSSAGNGGVILWTAGPHLENEIDSIGSVRGG
jgi:predicted outer membrane repeat protein